MGAGSGCTWVGAGKTCRINLFFVCSFFYRKINHDIVSWAVV